jgi:transposase
MLDGRVEIITGRERRRRWRLEDKLRIVAEAEAPGARVAHVAALNEVSRSLLWTWRAQVRRGELRPEPSAVFMPVQVADAPLPVVVPPREVATSRLPHDPAPRDPSAGQIEVELPDGSKLRVGAEVSLVALRRVVAALRR